MSPTPDATQAPLRAKEARHLDTLNQASDPEATVAPTKGVTRRFAVGSAVLAAAFVAMGAPLRAARATPTLTITPRPLSLAVTARAADVVDRLGVVTHNNYNDGSYANTAKVMEAMRFLGLTHFRDTNFRPEDQGQNALREVVAAGFKITAYLRGGTTPAEQVNRLREFASIRPGGLAMIEGFNEINNEPISYQGIAGERGAQRFMEEFYALVRADDLLKDIPIAGFTNYPASSSKCDVLTIHPYAKHGAQPRATMEDDLRQARVAGDGSGANKPFIITETGYHTAPRPTPAWETVDEATQAKLLLNTYTGALSMGALRVFIYQLFNGYPGDGQESHFGLYRLDLSPKPAALAIANLTALLADGGATARTFETRALRVTVTGAPPTGRSFLAEKSNGSFAIVTWAEGDCWDERAHRPIDAPVVHQTINFRRRFARVEVFDPLLGPRPITTATAASRVVVPVSDHPVIVMLSD